MSLCPPWQKSREQLISTGHSETNVPSCLLSTWVPIIFPVDSSIIQHQNEDSDICLDTGGATE